MSAHTRRQPRPRALRVLVVALPVLAVGIAVLPASSSPASSSAVAAVVSSGLDAKARANPGVNGTAKSEARGDLMVIGDSISLTFNDKRGSPNQAFWSMLARKIGARAQVVAEGGAGFVRPGLVGCRGSTFSQQLKRAEVQLGVSAAHVLIIEGGRNDTRVCAGGGNSAPITTAHLRKRADVFMKQVAALRVRNDDCTIVITPWGPRGTDTRRRITPVIRRSANRFGFTFVDTSRLLTKATTRADGVHPNRAGNRAIAREIMRRSFAEACIPVSSTARAGGPLG